MQILHTDNYVSSLQGEVSRLAPDKVFILTDSNVAAAIHIPASELNASLMVIPPGESQKSIESAARLWKWLTDSGATRRSLLINIGGGVITDLGGFVAGTFKRGIRFINVPTTLLAMADAAIGGKTGIDFCGLKNEIGVFAPADNVVICPAMLKTLPEDQLRSGFAEVVKMAAIANPGLYDELLLPDALHNPEILARGMRFAADEKLRIVTEDPREKGLRKVLNFGHTAGHAYESYAAALGHPISHGEAVAHGMLRAFELSHERLDLPAEYATRYKECILDRYYSPLPFDKEDPEVADKLNALMLHDKKNTSASQISYLLLTALGQPAL